MSIGLLVFVALAAIAFAFYLGRRTKSKTANLNSEVDNKITDKDAWEGTFYDGEDPKKVSAYLQIDYVDGEGKETSRSIRVRQFDDRLYGGMILAHCEMRDSSRTFRYDRVKSCVDLETGEVVHDLSKYLNDIYNKSPEKTLDILYDDFIDVLKVVLFVAKADGQYRKEEKEVVSKYLCSLTKDDRLTIDMLDDVFQRMEFPTLHAFKLAMGRIIKTETVDLYVLKSCCKAIVATQKTVSASEQEALDYLEKKIV